jgi:hypothetical protein
MNAYEDMLIEAIDLVASQDLPDDQLSDALLAQVRIPTQVDRPFRLILTGHSGER